jgi:hypothetical protein
MATHTSEDRLLQALKSAAQFVGLIGGGGAGFAGLAFGIGYLATKHHDAMLGLPTTTTDTTTYVRTGALFFTQTLHDLVAVLAAWTRVPSPEGWAGALVAALLVVAVAWWQRARLAQLAHNLDRAAWLLLVVGWVLIFGIALIYLPHHLAALDAGNKNLLFEQRELSSTAAARVRQQLRDERGEQRLHHLYGTQWAITVALALSLVMLRQWRNRIAATGPENPLVSAAQAGVRSLDWTIAPASYFVVGAMLLTTPANYGVLAMSSSLPCVQLFGANPDDEEQALGEPGYLVSDLSSEKARIAVLRWDTSRRTYFVDLHPREALNQMEVRACGVRNPIHRVLDDRNDSEIP